MYVLNYTVSFNQNTIFFIYSRWFILFLYNEVVLITKLFCYCKCLSRTFNRSTETKEKLNFQYCLQTELACRFTRNPRKYTKDLKQCFQWTLLCELIGRDWGLCSETNLSSYFYPFFVRVSFAKISSEYNDIKITRRVCFTRSLKWLFRNIKTKLYLLCSCYKQDQRLLDFEKG